MPLQKQFNDAVTDTVIFLDFDGPLSTFRVFAQAESNLDFDPVAVGILRNVCEVANARIVCTSVRTFPHWQIYNETKRLFDEAGLDLTLLHPDWTVNKTNIHKRKDNIEAFLADHPEITNYVIVDDDYVDIPEKLVRVDALNGIMVDDIEKICEILGIESSDVYQRDWHRNNSDLQYHLPFDDMNERMNANIAKKEL